MKKFIILLAFSFCFWQTSSALNYYWVGGTGNWSDISHLAVKGESISKPFSFEEGWMNGEKEII